MVEIDYTDILNNPNLTKEQKLQIIKGRKDEYDNDIMKSYAKDVAKMWGAEAAELGLAAFSGSKVKYLPEMIAGLRLLYHKPFEKMTPKEQIEYRNKGEKFYKKYIQNKPVNNDVIGDIDFKGRQAGKPDFQYMEQYPKLRENIKNATENIFIKAKPKLNDNGNLILRKDATGFDNLKVNWRGKNYDYQIRHNPALKTPDFYNIKPYDLLIQELKNGTP